MTIHVPAGSVLALVGATGAGKSTLAAMTTRLTSGPLALHPEFKTRVPNPTRRTAEGVLFTPTSSARG